MNQKVLAHSSWAISIGLCSMFISKSYAMDFEKDYMNLFCEQSTILNMPQTTLARAQDLPREQLPMQTIPIQPDELPTTRVQQNQEYQIPTITMQIGPYNFPLPMLCENIIPTFAKALGDAINVQRALRDHFSYEIAQKIDERNRVEARLNLMEIILANLIPPLKQPEPTEQSNTQPPPQENAAINPPESFDQPLTNTPPAQLSRQDQLNKIRRHLLYRYNQKADSTVSQPKT